MSTTERPLSPHLQVYRWRISMFTSIMHRASGAFLSLGTLVLTWFLIAAATEGDYFSYVSDLLAHPIAQLLLFGWTLAFFYHLANGVRHLFWDIGKGFEKATYRTTGWLAVAFAVVMTVVVWYPVVMGGAA
ncbi:MAG: succinate dehydrogenase, cytochrome b556 subunit [Gammaproteobacteria bacterium]|nr:succinate dehydrogenase, cytochrome b556 subunit [Gammaproteobacteria bacterium]